MSHIKRHPAPGFGDLLPGWFSVPQNPIRDAGTALVPSPNAGGVATRVPRLGELMPAAFSVPQNPLIAALATVGKGPYNQPLSGMGCMGCGGGANYGMQGLGAFDLTSIETWFTAASPLGTGVPNWMFYGGLAAGAYFFLGGTGAKGSRRGHASAAAPATAANPRRRRRNESVEQGFYAGGVFHPIRASSDYDPEAVGESRQYAKAKKRKKGRRK